MTRRRIITSEKQDMHTGWRHRFVWTARAGATKAVKRRTNRRERREARIAIRRERDEGP